MPDVHGKVGAGDRSDRAGDAGRPPAGHHCPPDRGGEAQAASWPRCVYSKVLIKGLSALRLVPSQEIYKDRKKFSEQVFKVASSDLVNMGISVVSYTLKDVHDDQVNQHMCSKLHFIECFLCIGNHCEFKEV